MIVLDTSVLIDLLRGELNSSRFDQRSETLATCFPIECELYKGTKMARRTEEGRKQVDDLLDSLHSLESDIEVARKFAGLYSKYSELPEFDLLIAAHCLVENVELMTQDEDFARIEELKLKEI